MNLVTREILTGIPVIRAFSREKFEEDRFETANEELTKTNLFVNRCMTFMMPVMMLIMNGVSVMIIYFGAHAVDNGSMQVGNVMAFIQYAMQIIMSFLLITAMSIMIPRANVAAVRINQVLETEGSIEDPVSPEAPQDSLRGTVEFDHVSFAYPEAGENVLNDISFTAKKGQTVAVIGSTGSGKSTLVNLIPRFYDATQGTVKVDGVDVRKMTQHQLRECLGYVPQKESCSQELLIPISATEKKTFLLKKYSRQHRSPRPQSLLIQNPKSTTHRSHRAVPTYLEARNSVCPLQERLPRSRRFLFLMTAFLHWTLKRTVI